MITSLLSFKSNMMKKLVTSIGGQEYLTVQIDITNACNLKCSHCYHPNHINKGALSLNDWFEVISQYKKLINKLMVKPSFVICGGEPLLSPMLRPFIEKVRQEWPLAPISLLTNGTLLTAKNISLLKEFDISIQVSLDGPSADQHDLKRGKGNFEKSKAGIKLALDSDISVHILAVLSKQSSQWITDFFKLARDLKVYSMNFTRLIVTGSGQEMVKSGEDSSLIGLELRDAYISILKNSKQYGVTTNTNKPLFCLIDKNLGASAKFGFQGLVVDYKGNLKVSSRTDFILGNVLSEGLEKLFLKHPILKKLRQGKFEGCNVCEYLAQCGGDRNVSYVENGTYLGIDSGCWMPEILNLKGENYEVQKSNNLIAGNIAN